ncbi:MAG: cyclic lactone autoinducer peptide [Clostridia bacterium]|nr:cyclic lactone autoinducer peptide [Clostridia bacterium]
MSETRKLLLTAVKKMVEIKELANPNAFRSPTFFHQPKRPKKLLKE